MADYYVYSAAAGAANGSSWADAYTSLAVAVSGKAAGDRFFVAHDHAFSQASSMTITFPGTAASPNTVLCVDRAGSVPPVSADLRTTATESTTGSSALTVNGSVYVEGVSFTRESSAANQNLSFGTTGANTTQVYKNCAHKLNSTGASAKIMFGLSGSANYFLLVNTTLGFSAVGQQMQISGPVQWQNTASAIAGTVPTTLILPATGGSLYGANLDLSASGSGKNLVDVSIVTPCQIVLHDCKLGASVSITTGSVAGQGGVHVTLVNCDSADTNYRYYFQHYQGSVTQEATIVRTGGASDGTTSFSRKLVSTANSNLCIPHESPWFKFWNETLGAMTIAIETVTDNVTLTDAEAWIEVDYPGTSGFPLYLRATDRVADILATGSNQTTSSETWTTTGLTTPVKQTVSVSVTPAEIGWVYARLCLAKPSTTVYCCPKILSGAEQFMEAPTGDVVNVAAGGGSGGVMIPGGMLGGMRG